MERANTENYLNELRRKPLLRGWVNKGKRAGTTALALLPMIVRFLSGSPYLAIHLLKERLAPLVALLVIAKELELLHGKVAEAS